MRPAGSHRRGEGRPASERTPYLRPQHGGRPVSRVVAVQDEGEGVVLAEFDPASQRVGAAAVAGARTSAGGIRAVTIASGLVRPCAPRVALVTLATLARPGTTSKVFATGS